MQLRARDQARRRPERQASCALLRHAAPLPCRSASGFAHLKKRLCLARLPPRSRGLLQIWRARSAVWSGMPPWLSSWPLWRICASQREARHRQCTCCHCCSTSCWRKAAGWRLLCLSCAPTLCVSADFPLTDSSRYHRLQAPHPRRHRPRHPHRPCSPYRRRARASHWTHPAHQ